MTATSEFTKALNALGTTDQERAQALGMSRVTLIEWKSGRLPIQIKRLLDQPQLIVALATDAQAAQTTTVEATA
jgi:hypothetical protein